MPVNNDLAKLKQEALELADKKRMFLVFGFVLLGGFLIFLIFGLIVLIAAFDGELHFYASYILLTLSFNFLIGSIVMWILRKAIFGKRLKEKQAEINKNIHSLKSN